MQPYPAGDQTGTQIVDLAIRLAVLGLVAAWCFTLLRPFATMVVWGAILAVALGPLFQWLKHRCGGRGWLAAIVLTLFGIAVIVGPVSVLVASLVSSADSFARDVRAGAFELPPLPPGVRAWPWIGSDIAAVWADATDDLEAVATRFAPQLKAIAEGLAKLAAGAGFGLLQFVAAMVIAGIMLPQADKIALSFERLVHRLAPYRSIEFIDLATATIRNVARGVVGIAVLQALLLGVGFLVAGIPFAGVWTLLCTALSIIQIGPGLVVLGTLIYAWSTLDSLTALLFTLWMVPMTLLDNVLKPIVMAHGLPVPMLVIFLGVIGGTIVHGIIGLFVGPMILAIGYDLMRTWVRGADRGGTAP